MATSERSPRSTHEPDSRTAPSDEGAGMAHLTVVPTNLDDSDAERE
ncbi:hypothetical protein Halru_1901 [Halovivax ruber XH-70]|uniref:Uncharacterized protein n=1 Tax=Halovivax ruber (strain DSM 18193 / JCM 13892 / XH-70) TaxID=797302 RepID=L0ICL4_HALRX|nr:hypothetical protein [Halovivax ruber]AGB16499.1 hypothetical protein Halru_1901 [Halovivax ruber XH-70]